MIDVLRVWLTSTFPGVILKISVAVNGLQPLVGDSRCESSTAIVETEELTGNKS